ncbi:MAG: NAD-dependent SIR2 family protein deacetylase [Candidatus Azotimanducaceae bacterium]|jgi:NAD-dependent SIR2 family protein deacetylase
MNVPKNLMLSKETSEESSTERLAEFIQAHQPLVVITGAGCSAASGIPTYRDDDGTWQRSTPIQHQDFVSQPESRQRYWARSLAGWPAVARAQPNETHLAIKTLEDNQLCALVVTQNVDRLHQRSGQQAVIDLHGRLDRVHCLDCHHEISRDDMQIRLMDENPHLPTVTTQQAPDGDADIPDNLIETVHVPDCDHCGGMLKPTVVFYGGGVSKLVVDRIFDAIDQASGVLVVGSSLMVFSSFRFCRHAAKRGLPIAIVNAGKTRADDLATFKLDTACEIALPAAVQLLTNE